MEDSDLYDIVNLGYNYSAVDEERRALLIRQLSDLQQDFRRAAQPYLNQLARIDANYTPRYVIVPKGK